MIVSMTGYSARKGLGEGASWQWDIRSVNGKGLDLRLRMPEWIVGLEAKVRAELGRRIQRGNVTLSLKLQLDVVTDAMRINPVALGQAVSALAEVILAAEQRGLILAPSTPSDLLAMRGVLEQAAAGEDDTAPLCNLLVADLAGLLDDFCQVRQAEGAALHAILMDQVDQVETLTRSAADVAAERRVAMATSLKDALSRVLSNADGVDETRLAQELAFIAVKADVTEEIDRLNAHVAAARALLAEPGTVGRKLDFLTQEFNREANTLCSKAQVIALTRIGLDLKTVIDQMREQIQNVE